MWLTRLALRNPILILMTSLMVIVLGLVSLSRLGVDLFPNIAVPVVRVNAFYAGAGPADVEKTLTQPIERAVSAAPGAVRVESTSKQGAALLSVWFDFGTDLDAAMFDVQQRIAQVQSSFPAGVTQPFILKFDITNIPVTQLVVDAPDLDEQELYDLAYNLIEPQIERLPGVASATVSGGKVREIQVRAQPAALRARGVDLLDLMRAVRSSNLLLPSGTLVAGTRDYNVFTNTQITDPVALEDVVVSRPVTADAQPVHVRDVAEVVDHTADQKNIVRVNGRRGVYLRVLKQPGANTIGVVDAVRAAIPNLRGLPPGLRVSVSFDQSTYIRAAVKSLEHEALQGGLLAVIVILIFLGSLRATSIVAIAIPLSIVATFALLWATGQTLNVFTLGGLALGVGRLVDDSIVELENIERHLRTGRTRTQAVLEAAREVAMPILVSTITTIVVFFPVLFLSGVARYLFVPLALTISFALGISFVVSRTVTPVLCARWLRVHAPGEPAGPLLELSRRLEVLDRAYARMLTWALGRRAFVVTVIFVAAGSTLLLARQVGTEFFPDSDESQATVTYRAPIATRVEDTEKVAEAIERRVLDVAKDPKTGAALVSTMLSDNGLSAGRSASFSPNSGPHAGNLQVNLVPKVARSISDVQVSEQIRAGLRGALPGVQLFLGTGGIVKRILNFGSPAPIDVEILGYDLSDASSYAIKLAQELRALRSEDGAPLLTDVQISREEDYPELDVVVDREKAGRLGVSQEQVAQTMLASLVGSNQVAPIPFTDPRSGNEYFVNVRLADEHRSRVADLGEVFVRTSAGATVSLASLATIERASGPVAITRRYLQRVVDITANVRPGRSLGEAGARVQAVLDGSRPPDGFTVQQAGQVAAQADAFRGLGFAALLAVALVYMVLASQFKSLLDPLVVMLSVPLGVAGVIVMLWATKTTLSVNSFMGIIMMVGIVVSNGVLLVDFANVLRRRGVEMYRATVEAAATRLRPILMTTLATVFGLAPMALGIGEGSEANVPLARAVIGGLSVSTVLTLFLVPALYTALSRRELPPDESDDELPAARPASP